MSQSELSAHSPDIRIDIKRMMMAVFISCLAIELALFVADAFIAYAKWIPTRSIQRLFNLTREDGLGTWFSSMQALFVGITLALIFWVKRQDPNSRWERRGWATLAIFFTYVAIDDGAAIHERLGTTFRETVELPFELFEVFPSYSWQLIFGPLFAGLGIFMVVFLWRKLSWRLLRLCALTGLTCFVLAVGLDFLEGLDEATLYRMIRKGFELRGYTVRHFSKTIEEFIEMMGTTLFWIAFLGKLATLIKGVDLRLMREKRISICFDSTRKITSHASCKDSEKN